MALNGPIVVDKNAADGNEWANCFSQHMLLMCSYGPIGATEEYCQWS